MVECSFKCLWVRISLLSLKIQIWHLLRARSSLIFRQTIKCGFTLKEKMTYSWETLLGGIKKWEFTFWNFCGELILLLYEEHNKAKILYNKRIQRSYHLSLGSTSKIIYKIKPQVNFRYLWAIPATEKKKASAGTCKHCPTKENRKKSRYQCLKCPRQAALCIQQCFRLYHDKIGVAQTESSSESEQDWDYLMENKRDLLVLLMTWLYFYPY